MPQPSNLSFPYWLLTRNNFEVNRRIGFISSGGSAIFWCLKTWQRESLGVNTRLGILFVFWRMKNHKRWAFLVLNKIGDSYKTRLRILLVEWRQWKEAFPSPLRGWCPIIPPAKVMSIVNGKFNVSLFMMRECWIIKLWKKIVSMSGRSPTQQLTLAPLSFLNLSKILT